MLDEAERRQLLQEWNQTAAAVPAGTAADLVAAQAARTPDAVAVDCAGSWITYRELDERANRVARCLQQAGVVAGTVAALWLDRSADLLTAMLAVWKAGAAYLPVDMTLAARRAGFMLADTKAVLAVAPARWRGAVPDGLPVVEWEELAGRSGVPAAGDPGVPSMAGRLAYVIYTSGSTGVPKGAMVEQGGMVNHLLAKVADLGLGAGDVVAATASPGFDISVWQLVAVLLAGGRVCVVADEDARDPARWLAVMGRRGVTVAEVVPSLLRALGEEAGRAGAGRPGLGSLRWLLVTGEALAGGLCRAWQGWYPAVPLVNAYGPTECSDDVTHHRVAGVPADGAVPIGRPVANTRLYVLDGFCGRFRRG